MRWLVPYLVVSLGALAGVPLLPAQAGQVAVVAAVGALAALAILAGARRNLPSRVRPWQLVAGGAVALTAGACAGFLPDSAWSTAADAALAAAGLLLLSAALAAAHRAGGPRGIAGLVDTGVVLVAAVATAWLILIEPLLYEAGIARIDRIAGLTVVLAALVLVGFVVRTLLAVAASPEARCAVAVATGFALGGAGLFAYGFLDGGSDPMSVALAWVLSCVAWGGLALHPRMAGLTETAEEPSVRPTVGRTTLLAASVTVTVAAVLANVAAVGDGRALAAVAAALVLLALLVARTVETILGYERAARREHVLRDGAAALVAAHGRDDVAQIAAQTATELAGGTRDAFVEVSFGSRPELRVENAVVLGGGEVGISIEGELRRNGRLGRAGTAKTIVLPLVVRGKLAGLLRVTGRRPLAHHVHRAMQTLAAQVQLALEGIALSDDLLERRSEDRFRSLVQNSKDLIAVVEENLVIRFVTPSVQAMLGWAPTELVGSGLGALLHPDEEAEVREVFSASAGADGRTEREFRLRHRDGRFRTIEGVVGNLLADPSVRGFVLTAHDVTERRQLEAELAHQAFHDSLTALPNRALFADRVTHALDRAHRSGSSVAVLFLDVDDFKTVNDSLGHGVGDELLVEVARRLSDGLRSADTAARLGGDEFGILLEDADGADGAVTAAQRVLASLAEPIAAGGRQFFARASVGIVVGRQGDTAVELLRNADVAMYKAKRQGGNRFEVFDPAMHAAAVTRLQVKADLERALEAAELELEYQPIVRLADGGIVGLEALLRWTHPVRGRISPADFVPLAEETGLIVAVGEWVLRAAVAQASAWRRTLPPPGRLSLSVNLSGRQLQSAGLVDMVADVLSGGDIVPSDLVLELTESSLMDDVDLVAGRLADLKELGVRIAVDDFGTGFSSLGYLQRFPVDILKVAKPFVDEVATDERKAKLCQAIVRLAGSLDLNTVAEGIEDDVQRRLLHDLGCDLGQGYLFSRPLPVAMVPAALGLGATEAAA